MKKYLALGLAALLAIGATIVPDTYDKLFLRCNGTTTTFVDSSTASPKTITANGNATQLPIKFNKSAGFFNGTTDKLIIQDSTDFDLNGNFSMETFVNFSLLKSGTFICQEVDGNNYWGFGFNNSTKKLTLLLGISGSAVISKSETWSPSINTWYHVEAIRTGTSLSLYVDGVELGSPSNVVTTWSTFESGIEIGYDLAAGGYGYFSGWMKELRISKVARTVAVPTTQYTSDANTVLLMHFDTPATSPLAPAIAFDGTVDCLQVAAHADWNFGTNGLTLEAFVFGNSNGEIMAWKVPSVPTLRILIESAKIKMMNVGSIDAYLGSQTLVANRWNHIALVRSGNTYTGYINGVAGDAPQTGAEAQDLSSRDLAIGVIYTGSYGNYFTGSMREIRISNIARYTTAFTPSQSGWTVDANTKLYIKGDENNGVTTFVDATGKTVTTAGDTKIKYTEDYRSCIFKDETGKFPYPVGSAKVDFFAIGSGVGYFDGTNSYLTVPDSADFNFAAGDFTEDFYLRTPTVATAMVLMAQTEADGFSPVKIAINSSKLWLLASSNGSAWDLANNNAATTLLSNVWYHVSVVRSGTNLLVFLNGLLDLTVAVSTTALYDSGSSLYVGQNRLAGQPYFYSGLLDNIRISKGVARYTTTFNPPDDYQSAPSYNKSQFFALL